MRLKLARTLTFKHKLGRKALYKQKKVQKKQQATRQPTQKQRLNV
jgi:hypothetical protein